MVKGLSKVGKFAEKLCSTLAGIDPPSSVAYVYNPLLYARAAYLDYVKRYAFLGHRVLMLGMNPGPWGMAQTGVPFGEVMHVRDWLGVRGKIRRPEREHLKRPVLGWACKRREVSGLRLWGWAKARFGRPEAFFQRFFVLNYCPLMFMEAGARNLTPDKLPAAARSLIEAACDEHLWRMVDLLKPRGVVGVGQFAERRAREALAAAGLPIIGILHPSPASPAANRDWAGRIEAQLEEADGPFAIS